MGKTILFGEPMALLIADTTGPLEDVEHFTRAVSGAEVNVAVGLSRLGHEVSYLTRLGDDPFGHHIEKMLQRNGIDTAWVTYDPVYRTGIQLKNRVEDGSDPFAPYYRKGSAASHISVREIDAMKFSDVEHVHITGIPAALSKSSRKAVFRLMERARENGVYVTFDPNLRPALWEDEETMRSVTNELAAGADMILPGTEECRILTGTADPEKAADYYENLGVETIIVKMGASGAYVRSAGESYTVEGFRVEHVVDTVGAGDGFAVGVISGRLEGLSLRDMVRRANAIGAMQVMNIGDNEGLPDRKKLADFMETNMKKG